MTCSTSKPTTRSSEPFNKVIHLWNLWSPKRL